MLSRWSVPSQQTAELMSGFYKSLLTLDYSVALRLAKMEIREKYPHPFIGHLFL